MKAKALSLGDFLLADGDPQACSDHVQWARASATDKLVVARYRIQYLFQPDLDPVQLWLLRDHCDTLVNLQRVLGHTADEARAVCEAEDTPLLFKSKGPLMYQSVQAILTPLGLSGMTDTTTVVQRETIVKNMDELVGRLNGIDVICVQARARVENRTEGIAHASAEGVERTLEGVHWIRAQEHKQRREESGDSISAGWCGYYVPQRRLEARGTGSRVALHPCRLGGIW